MASETEFEKYEKRLLEILEERVRKMSGELVGKHTDELNNLVGEMLRIYKNYAEEMLKNLRYLKEEGQTGLLQKTTDVKIHEIANTTDKETEVVVDIQGFKAAFRMEPKTKFRFFVVKIPAGPVVEEKKPEEKKA